MQQNQSSTHTPGPWSFEHVPGELGHVVTVAEGEIAEAFSEVVGTEQAVANARLIAAAPDGLELAEAVMRWFDKDRECSIYALARNFVRKAKAEG